MLRIFVTAGLLLSGTSDHVQAIGLSSANFQHSERDQLCDRLFVNLLGTPLTFALTLSFAWSDDQSLSLQLATATVYVPISRKGIVLDDQGAR